MHEDNASHDRRHLLLMVLCCLIPLAGLAAIYLFGAIVPKVLTFGLLLFCPLSHILMLTFMGREHREPTASESREAGPTSAAACHPSES